MPKSAGKMAELYMGCRAPALSDSFEPGPPHDQDLGDRHWYAVYTRPRHEKNVARHFESRSLECFLPLYRTIRNWQHRHATFDLPLFPCYVFVHIALHERMKVVTSPGVLYLIGRNGDPEQLRDGELEALRTVVASRNVYPTQYLPPGARVCFSQGPFAGLVGTVVRSKGQLRVVVSIDAITRSISVDVDQNELQLACGTHPFSTCV